MSNKRGRGLICVFCGESFGYEGETPDEATLKAAVDHEKDCRKNPYKAEIAMLKEALSTGGPILIAAANRIETLESVLKSLLSVKNYDEQKRIIDETLAET